MPASFTGIFGFRPTHGRVSKSGVVAFAPSYDTVGWLARDPVVLRRVGETLLGEADAASDDAGAAAPPRRLVLVRDAFSLAEDGAAAALESHARRWGAVNEISVFDGAPDEWLECYRVLQGAEIWQELGPWISARRPIFGPSIAPRFADAATITAAAVTQYRALRKVLAQRLHGLMSDGTALVIPTAPGPALARSAPPAEISLFYRSALPLNGIAGHAGLPQVTIPVVRIAGCPLGLSIVGAPGADLALLRLAATLPNLFDGPVRHV